MIDEIKKRFCKFHTAWQTVLDFPPLPNLTESCTLVSKASGVVVYFPIIGVIAALMIVLPVVFIASVSNEIAGAIIYATCATILWELKDSGRGSIMITSFFVALFRKTPFVNSVISMRSDRSILEQPSAEIIYLLTFICRWAGLFILSFYGAKFWLVVILTASFTVQGDLASRSADGGSAAPLLAVQPDERRNMWLVAGVIALFVFLPFFTIASIASAAAAYIISSEYSRVMARSNSGMTAEGVTAAGAFTEYITLFIGILWAITV
jgi:hypothetical protein